MSKAEIFAGICGFETTVEVESDASYNCKLKIRSNCPDVNKMAQTLIKDGNELNVMNELFRPGESQVMEASKDLPHITCPVSIGILKAMEVSTGMALPKDASIKIEK